MIFVVVGYLAGKRVHITPTVDRSEIRHPPAEGTVVHPITYKVLYIPGGAGVLHHQQYHTYGRGNVHFPSCLSRGYLILPWRVYDNVSQNDTKFSPPK